MRNPTETEDFFTRDIAGGASPHLSWGSTIGRPVGFDGNPTLAVVSMAEGQPHAWLGFVEGRRRGVDAYAAEVGGVAAGSAALAVLGRR
jgi:hypothetical protein